MSMAVHHNSTDRNGYYDECPIEGCSSERLQSISKASQHFTSRRHRELAQKLKVDNPSMYKTVFLDWARKHSYTSVIHGIPARAPLKQRDTNAEFSTEVLDVPQSTIAGQQQKYQSLFSSLPACSISQSKSFTFSPQAYKTDIFPERRNDSILSSTILNNTKRNRPYRGLQQKSKSFHSLPIDTAKRKPKSSHRSLRITWLPPIVAPSHRVSSQIASQSNPMNFVTSEEVSLSATTTTTTTNVFDSSNIQLSSNAKPLKMVTQPTSYPIYTSSLPDFSPENYYFCGPNSNDGMGPMLHNEMQYFWNRGSPVDARVPITPVPRETRLTNAQGDGHKYQFDQVYDDSFQSRHEYKRDYFYSKAKDESKFVSDNPGSDSTVLEEGLEDEDRGGSYDTQGSPKSSNDKPLISKPNSSSYFYPNEMNFDESVLHSQRIEQEASSSSFTESLAIGRQTFASAERFPNADRGDYTVRLDSASLTNFAWENFYIQPFFDGAQNFDHRNPANELLHDNDLTLCNTSPTWSRYLSGPAFENTKNTDKRYLPKTRSSHEF
ncbi:hypothetical protein V1511DRAFT_505179 [Dipodascopsis uninucleata]